MEYLLSLLPYLACPVAMSLAMWLMMRGQGQQRADAAPPISSSEAAVTVPPDGLAQLREQLGALRARQAAIAAEVTLLEGSPDEPAGEPLLDTAERARLPTGQLA